MCMCIVQGDEPRAGVRIPGVPRHGSRLGTVLYCTVLYCNVLYCTVLQVVRGDIRREEVRAAATAATTAMLGFLTTYLK